MAYSISKLSPYPTNKPSIEDMKLYEDEYPHLREYPNGRTLRISNPKPDKIYLSVPLIDDVLTEKIASQVDIADRCEAISQKLCAGHANSCIVPNTNKAAFGKPYEREFQLEIGTSDVRIFCQLLNSKKQGPRLCIRYNPTRCGAVGHQAIAALLFGASWSTGQPIFDRNCFAHFAKLTQIDIAVDCIGVLPNEIVIRRAEIDGLTLYSAGNGLETLYLRNASQPEQRSLVKVYNKSIEAASKQEGGQEPMPPVTRIEVTRKGLKNKHLIDIFDLPDPFQKIRCGLAYAQGAACWRKLQVYRALRFQHRMASTAEIMELPSGAAAGFETINRTVPVADLVRPKINWSGWFDGLSASGIDALLPVLDKQN